MDIFELAKARILAGKGSGGGGGGGGGSSVSPKDVNFYDYDGTLLHSYTVAEAQALSELPPLPTQKGLVCQGWNWTLDEIKEVNCAVDVGATYITNDGKTRLYIRVATDDGFELPLYFSQNAANATIIDWGDGSATERVNATGVVNTVHNYTSAGNYVITLNPVDTTKIELGNNNTYGVFGTHVSAQSLALTKVEIGRNCGLGQYAFFDCYNLESIVFPTGSEPNMQCFNNCHHLLCVILPIDCTSVSQGYFQSAGVSFVSIPYSVSRIGSGAFRNCGKLKRIPLLPNLTFVDEYAFYGASCLSGKVVIPIGVKQNFVYSNTFGYCFSLTSVELLNSPTTISSNAFINCYSLTNLKIPSSVTTINATAFSGCVSMKYYDFTSHTVVPSLKNASAFTGIPADCEIRVPASLYDEWRSATNWSNFADNIVAK